MDNIIENQKNQCIFCQLISGSKESYKVYEDDKVLAILDIAPANKGHVLLIPKMHYPIMPAVPEDILNHLFKIAQGISQALLKAMLVSGTNIFVANGAFAGQQIPHFVVHIIPREKDDGIDVFNTRSINIDTNILSDLQKALAGNLHLKLQDKLAEQGLLQEAEISQEELIKLIESNPKLKEFLKSNIDNLTKVLDSNPQLEMMFRGKDIEAIKKILLKSADDKQSEAVSDLLKGKKVERKDKKEELLKEIELESTEETPEEKALREKLSVKKKKTNNKKVESVDLDDIANLLSGDKE